MVDLHENVFAFKREVSRGGEREGKYPLTNNSNYTKHTVHTDT